jgi:serine/threonine protein kinase
MVGPDANAVAAEANAPALPRRFGKYELLEKIGSGGMAEIFLARLTGIEGFEKLLVVKKILPGFASNRSFVKMLIEEAKISSVLHHPNVVQIYDLGQVDDQYFIAMEYVHGKDLLKILSRCVNLKKRIPLKLSIYIVAEVCKGLSYAHAARDLRGQPLHIIHRDVSPSNVILSFDGDVKIMDFGVARARNQQDTRSGVLKGKLGYMSPEQVTGQSLDFRSDIFSLGTILYEAITLKRLFLGKTDLETLINIRDVRIEKRLEKHSYIPQPIADIIRTACARLPEERFPTAMEMHDALIDFLFEQGLRVRPRDVGEFIQEVFDEDHQLRLSVPPEPLDRELEAAAAAAEASGEHRESDADEEPASFEDASAALSPPHAEEPSIERRARLTGELRLNVQDGVAAEAAAEEERQARESQVTLRALAPPAAPADNPPAATGPGAPSWEDAVAATLSALGAPPIEATAPSSSAAAAAAATGGRAAGRAAEPGGAAGRGGTTPPTGAAVDPAAATDSRILAAAWRAAASTGNERGFGRSTRPGSQPGVGGGRSGGTPPPDGASAALAEAARAAGPWIGPQDQDASSWREPSESGALDSEGSDPGRFESVGSYKVTGLSGAHASLQVPVERRGDKPVNWSASGELPSFKVAEGSEISIEIPHDIATRLGRSTFRLRDNLGNVFGPVTFNNFLNLIKARAVTEQEMVSVDGGEWRPARSIPGIREVQQALFRPESSSPAIAGDIDHLTTPRMLYKLWAGRVTGKLKFSYRTTRKEVFFLGGKPQHVASSLKGELLGSYLVARKMVTPEQLQTAIQRMTGTREKLGDALVNLNYLRHHELFDTFQQLHKRKFLQLFVWNTGRFEFFDRHRPPRGVILLDLDLPGMIAEGVREFYGFEELKAWFKPHYRKRVLEGRPNKARVKVTDLRFNSAEMRFLNVLQQGGTVMDMLRDRARTNRDALTLFRVLFLLLEMDMYRLEG